MDVNGCKHTSLNVTVSPMFLPIGKYVCSIGFPATKLISILFESKQEHVLLKVSDCYCNS